jgi:hypothetical protein
MRTVSVTGVTLFDVAATYLGDATQWNRIAALHGISDPWLTGLTVLLLPDPDPSAGGGVGIQ